MTDQTTTTSWHSDESNRAEAYAQMRTLAYAEGMIPYINEQVVAHQDLQLRALLVDFGRGLTEFDTQSAAIQAWVDFLRTATPIVDTSTDEEITLTRSHNFGAVSVTVGITRRVDASTASRRAASFEYLDKVLEAELERWLRRNAAQVAGGSAGGGQNVSGSDYIEEPVTAIRHEYSNNKHLYKLVTPKYQKHGVPIYKEVLPELGFDGKIPLGETPLDGRVAKILMRSNGNPKKVVGIRRVD